MKYTLSLKPGAEDDIANAYNWYEDQLEGLGDMFLDELATVYKKLETAPEHFGYTTRIYRKALVARFPYIVIFEIRKTEVVIYAVFHTGRNPKKRT